MALLQPGPHERRHLVDDVVDVETLLLDGVVPELLPVPVMTPFARVAASAMSSSAPWSSSVDAPGPVSHCRHALLFSWIEAAAD